jgi:hypothetical protein
LTLGRQGWTLVRFIFIFYFVRLPLCNNYFYDIVTFISIHSVIICVVLFCRTYETHPTLSLNPGVTVVRTMAPPALRQKPHRHATDLAIQVPKLQAETCYTKLRTWRNNWEGSHRLSSCEGVWPRNDAVCRPTPSKASNSRYSLVSPADLRVAASSSWARQAPGAIAGL